MDVHFSCKKCCKIFDRQDHLIRHNNRKAPCYNELTCYRCGKDFNKLCNLKQHLNRKNPCEDNRYIKELDLKIEHEKRLIEEAKIKQKELDLKIIKASHSQNAGRDINNIENQYNNQITINNYNHEYNKNKNTISNMIVSNDLVQTIQNFF